MLCMCLTLKCKLHNKTQHLKYPVLFYGLLTQKRFYCTSVVLHFQYLLNTVFLYLRKISLTTVYCIQYNSYFCHNMNMIRLKYYRWQHLATLSEARRTDKPFSNILKTDKYHFQFVHDFLRTLPKTKLTLRIFSRFHTNWIIYFLNYIYILYNDDILFDNNIGL